MYDYVPPQHEEVLVNQEKVSLVLYSRSTCGYCKKILSYLQNEGKSITVRDIGQDPSAKDELIRVGHRKQVPCLFINGKPLYESSDILSWLKKNKNHY